MAKANASVIEAMGRMFETGLLSDLAVLVGADEYRFNVHKNVLSARSSVLEAMLQKRWTSQERGDASVVGDANEPMSSDTGIITLRFPAYGVEAFRIFLKFLYTDVIPEMSNLPVIFEVMNLAHLYDVTLLLDIIVVVLKKRISEGEKTASQMNECLQICTSVRNIHQQLSKFCFNIFEKNIRIAAENNRFLTWDVETIRAILQSESIDINELDLFKALMKWGEHMTGEEDEESKRSQALPELMNLIRFPAMGLKTFAAEVVPTQVFSHDDMLQMFLHFANPKSTPTVYNTRSRAIANLAQESLPDFDMYTTSGTIQYTESRISLLHTELKIQVHAAIILRGVCLRIKELQDTLGTEETCLFRFLVTEHGQIVGKAVSTIVIPGKESAHPIRLERVQLMLESPLVLLPEKSYNFGIVCKKYAPTEIKPVANALVSLYKFIPMQDPVESLHQLGKGVSANITYRLSKIPRRNMMSKIGWISSLVLGAVPKEPKPCIIT